MDSDTPPTLPSHPAAPQGGSPPPGGTVEPAGRNTAGKDRFQAPIGVPGERYELRDPFTEVTYRETTIPEIVAKADQLGSRRFIAVDEQGRRTTLQKVSGEWQRGPQHAAAAERPLDPTPTRDEVPQVAGAELLSTGPRQPDAANRRAMVKMGKFDAQAERAALLARLETALMERYVIKRAPVTVGDVTIGHTEYRFRGDSSRVAFTESTFRLATDTNSPSVARSMVDVAETRHWHALRVSGHEDFRRMVWLEASVRGVKTLGYEPNPGDFDLLKKERDARLVNRIEPEQHARDDSSAAAAPPADKASARGGGGRKAVLAAIEAVLVAKRVPEKQRQAVLAAATEQLAQRMHDGQAPRVKVYDKAAPSQRPITMPTPEVQRTRERSAPVR